MECRRCKQKYTVDEDEDPGADSPNCMMYYIGIEHPTVICMGCFDDWYITFSKQIIEHQTLEAIVAARLSGAISAGVEDAPLGVLCTKLATLENKINVESIVWVRKGTIDVLPDE